MFDKCVLGIHSKCYKIKKCMQLNNERGFERLKKEQTYSLPFCLVWLAGCKSGESLEKS